MTEFGSVNHNSFKSLQDIGTVVQHSRGVSDGGGEGRTVVQHSRGVSDRGEMSASNAFHNHSYSVDLIFIGYGIYVAFPSSHSPWYLPAEASACGGQQETETAAPLPHTSAMGWAWLVRVRLSLVQHTYTFTYIHIQV